MTALLSVSTMLGQGQNTDLSGTITGKEKYVQGNNAYLLDEYKLDYTYRVVMGSPVCVADMSWTRNNSFTVNKKSQTYQSVSEYADLKQRYDLLAPDSATFTYTMMFWSEQSNCYIASAKTSLTVPYIEKAGVTVAPEMPISLSWTESFSNVYVGQQSKDKPGTIVANATLDKAFDADKMLKGKLDKSVKGYGYTMRRIFSKTSRVDLVNVKVSIKWNDADYNYITDEYARRKAFAENYKKGNIEAAQKAYMNGRKYSPAVREESPIFWSTTVAPTEKWMEAIEEGDKLYAQKKWNEASVYYQTAVKANSEISYPANRLAKIKKYYDYKNNRNVRDLELVYVEGGKGIKSFYMSKMEITQAQWNRVMGVRSSSSFKGRNNPVENVSWEDAMAFIKELNRQTGMNYRLPRADEWEYAAKGGANASSSDYSGGNNLPDVAWCAYNASEQTHEVGTKTPNELGLYDMTGNVAEWVADIYDKTTRKVKGGSWNDDASGSAVSRTEQFPLTYKSNTIGFRVCQDE